MSIPLKQWACENGLGDKYEEYIHDCAFIADQCAKKSNSSDNSEYNRRIKECQKDYPELFKVKNKDIDYDNLDEDIFGTWYDMKISLKL